MMANTRTKRAVLGGELPYQTIEKFTGKPWAGGSSPDVVELLEQFGITAPAGSAEANTALAQELARVMAMKPELPAQLPSLPQPQQPAPPQTFSQFLDGQYQSMRGGPSVIEQMDPQQLETIGSSDKLAAAIAAIGAGAGGLGVLGSPALSAAEAGLSMSGPQLTGLGAMGAAAGKRLTPQGARAILDGLKQGTVKMTTEIRTLLDRFARETVDARKGMPWEF